MDAFRFGADHRRSDDNGVYINYPAYCRQPILFNSSAPSRAFVHFGAAEWSYKLA